MNYLLSIPNINHEMTISNLKALKNKNSVQLGTLVGTFYINEIVDDLLLMFSNPKIRWKISSVSNWPSDVISELCPENKTAR